MNMKHRKRFCNDCLYFLILIIFTFSIGTSVSAFEKSCCVLSRNELDDMDGIIKDCPDSPYHKYSDLATKCMKCPKGTCRHNSECICPRHFLEASYYKIYCGRTFGKEWPDSIGMEDDPDMKICKNPENEPPPSDISCCSLTIDQLNELRGWEYCPHDFFTIRLDDKCTKCPAGTCRLNKTCKCPDEFLNRISLHLRCHDSFSTSWPDSIGEEDIDLRSCPSKSEPAASPSPISPPTISPTPLSCPPVQSEIIVGIIGLCVAIIQADNLWAMVLRFINMFYYGYQRILGSS